MHNIYEHIVDVTTSNKIDFLALRSYMHSWTNSKLLKFGQLNIKYAIPKPDITSFSQSVYTSSQRLNVHRNQYSDELTVLSTENRIIEINQSIRKLIKREHNISIIIGQRPVYILYTKTINQPFIVPKEFLNEVATTIKLML